MPFKVPFTKDETYTRAEIDARIGGAAGGFAASLRTTVNVTAGASWNSDTTNSKSQGNTWYYADLVHGLGSMAMPLCGIDSNRFGVPIVDWQARDANTTRVWLAYNPAYTMSFKVLA